jgi:ComF family protein
MISTVLRPFCRRLLDLILPPLCVTCKAPVRQVGEICDTCLPQLLQLDPPFCGVCGVPLRDGQTHGLHCTACLKTPPVFTTARAPFIYEGLVRDCILRFKHGDEIHAAPTYAGWMIVAGRDLLAAADLIVPVPLHRWRLFRRRYNQSALLAYELSKWSGKPCAPDLLLRVRPTPSQGHLHKKDRRQNVTGAFGLNPRYSGQLAGKTVLLIDDVMTTGATVDSCAATLLEAGAKAVTVLTLARVPLG